MSIKCNICLQDETVLKCRECEFHSSQKCISEWFSNCGNFLCPQCKKDKTYKINYSKIEFKNKEKEEENIPGRLREMIDAYTYSWPSFVPADFRPLQRDSTEIINPVFNQLPIDIIVSEILKEDQLFSAETFIRNFNSLPIEIRAQWSYKPVKMEIDGVEEIIAYRISRVREAEEVS